MTAVRDLVTVVIPAYNAADTIGETLHSVRAQTHFELEILVVDDGSSDPTQAIVLEHAAADSRVQLIRQRNSGVAAARNLGIERARGELIAPIDADDLWRADKIERQLDALRRGGDQVGLVYTWSALIDDRSQVIARSGRNLVEGDVARRMCRGNLVGNGSSPLMRKAAIVEAGGYDASLRARSAQGCEDLKLYFAIAERHHFAVAPGYLTGYRQGQASMSSDVLQMSRSWEIVAAEILQRHPEFAADIEAGRIGLTRWLYRRAKESGRQTDALRLAWKLARAAPQLAFRTMVSIPLRQTVRRWLGRVATEPRTRFGTSLGDGLR